MSAVKWLIIVVIALLYVDDAMGYDIKNLGDLSQADTKVIVGFGSMHFEENSRKYLNQVNPAVGVEMWDIQAVYVTKNSWDKPSLYLTYAPDYKINDYFTLSGNIGLSTGYKCSNEMINGNVIIEISYCSDSGVVALGAVTLEYHPLKNGLSLAVSVHPGAAMFSTNYEF